MQEILWRPEDRINGGTERRSTRQDRETGAEPGNLHDALAEVLDEKGYGSFECGVLFEFPAAMIGDRVDETRSAASDGNERPCLAYACLCQLDGRAKLLFMTFDANRRDVRVYDDGEVPGSLAELGWSYARVLAHLPAIRAREASTAIN